MKKEKKVKPIEINTEVIPVEISNEVLQIHSKEKKWFVAVYTAAVKNYCDNLFFTALNAAVEHDGGCEVHVIDNTSDLSYMDSLSELVHNKDFLYHLDIPIEPKETLFHRRITESVNHLRELFLTTEYEYFVIIESDLLIPIDFFSKMRHAIITLETHSNKWAMIGGHYYDGFHDFKRLGVYESHHILSGCTVYNRSVIEKIPFRFSIENLAAFPDAWICYDVNKSNIEEKMYGYGDIICEHLTSDIVGRGRNQILKTIKKNTDKAIPKTIPKNINYRRR